MHFQDYQLFFQLASYLFFFPFFHEAKTWLGKYINESNILSHFLPSPKTISAGLQLL